MMIEYTYVITFHTGRQYATDVNVIDLPAGLPQIEVNKAAIVQAARNMKVDLPKCGIAAFHISLNH